MKTIIFLLLVFSSTICISQNRYTKLFENIDYECNSKHNINIIDSLVFDADLDVYISVKASKMMEFYWVGYIDGSTRNLKRGRIDYDHFKNMIKVNNKSLRSWILFLRENNLI